MTHVVEVWLEWEVCRGSTMYRATANTRWMAWLKVRLAAALLDFLLPRRYRDTDWSGRPCTYRYEYGIHYGVRKPTEHEAKHGVQPRWSYILPGHKGFSGEHSSAHPLDSPAEPLEDLGYKL